MKRTTSIDRDLMTRLILACFLSLLVTAASAQAPSPPSPTPPAAAKAVAKKKSAAKQSAATKPADQASTGPCQIGVIPITGNQFNVQQVGFTVFGNESAQTTMDGWGLDDLVVSRVRAAAGGRSVRRIAYTQEDLARTQESHSLFRNPEAETKEFVQRSVGNANCERYVVVHKSGSQFAGTNQSVNGFGIVKWSSLRSRVYLFALTFIRVYDGHTFELISKESASVDDRSAIERHFFAGPIRGPFREMDDASFPGAATEVGSNPALKEGVRALLASSLDMTLPQVLNK
jgi:hypothetical protein